MTRSDDHATIEADDQSVLAPESKPWTFFQMRHDEYQSCRKEAGELLGPHPEQTVEVFRQLGLNDNEIAQYFGASPHSIKRLSDGSRRSRTSRRLREVARLVRAKLFGETIK